MAVNSPGSYNNLKSPRSPRQLPQLPSMQQQPQQQQISGQYSPSPSIHNLGSKSPNAARVFEFPPEFHPETPNANFDFDVFAKSESVSDSRSSLLPESMVTESTSNNSVSYYRSPSFQNQANTGRESVRNSPDVATGLKSPVFQFCNPKSKFNKATSYSSKCPMSAGPLGPGRNRTPPTSCGSPQAFFPQKSPKPLDRGRRNSCFNLGLMKNPMSPTTIITAPTEAFSTSPQSSESSPKLYTNDLVELGSNFNGEQRGSRDSADVIGGYNKAATSSKQYYKPNVIPTQQQASAEAIQPTEVSARREHERNHERDSKRTRSNRMGSISLNKSHGSLIQSSGKEEEHAFPNESGWRGRGTCNPRNVARKSTSDLTELDADDVETEVTVLSSPRRRGSMKGGLAYLASRRGSRDSQISNVSNLSNEDIGPLNFNAHPRGRQRRTSNFLELPVPDHIRPRVHSLPEKAYNPRAGDDLYRLRAFSITHKGVVNRGDSIISRRSRSNTSVNSSRNSNVSGERSPFEGSCCSGQGVAGDSSESDIDEIPKYRVVLLGDSGVGKTALVSQFMTSEYINTYDASLDDEFGEKTVSILLDGEESQMIFIDHPHIEMSVENSLSTYEPHGCVVVYSVESRASFQLAEEILNYLWREHFTQDRSVIVVGNKSELARSRTIDANEGKQLATSRECKFIETSSGIQHNVDELLVGILKQIRLRETRDKKLRRQGSKGRMLSKLHGSKTALSLNLAREIMTKICMNDSKSKSCENLHVL